MQDDRILRPIYRQIDTLLWNDITPSVIIMSADYKTALVQSKHEIFSIKDSGIYRNVITIKNIEYPYFIHDTIDGNYVKVLGD